MGHALLKLILANAKKIVMTGVKYFVDVLIPLHYQNAFAHIREINKCDYFYLCEVVL